MAREAAEATRAARHRAVELVRWAAVERARYPRLEGRIEPRALLVAAAARRAGSDDAGDHGDGRHDDGDAGREKHDRRSSSAANELHAERLPAVPSTPVRTKLAGRARTQAAR